MSSRQPPLTLPEVEKFANSIFAINEPSVTEAYSDYGAELRRFANGVELCEFARALAKRRGGAMFLALHFPDTGGTVSIRRIALNPRKTGGANYRYCIEGWGLIFAQLAVGAPVHQRSSVSALSEERARAFENLFPGKGPVSDWDWIGVARHCRRLRSALCRLEHLNDG